MNEDALHEALRLSQHLKDALSVQIQLLALFALDLAAGLPAKSFDQFSLSVFLLESSIDELV